MASSSQPQGAPRLDALPPELQQSIFGYLKGDNSSLFAVIQVSKACHNFCIGMLWRVSTQKRLAKALTPGRRQYYADMIHDWDLDDDLSKDLFDGLEFPLLKGISFSGGSLSDIQLRHCLQSRLHTLRYIKCEIDTTILELPAACCSQLQELNMISPSTDNITPKQFMAFLQSLPALRRLHLNAVAEDMIDEVNRWKSRSLAHLEELTLTEPWESARSLNPQPWLLNDFLKYCTGLRKLHVNRGTWLSADTLTHLSCQKTLEVLHIDGRLDQADFEYQERHSTARSVPHPFLSIKDLSLSGRTSAITTLFSSAPKTLVVLDLQIAERHYDDDDEDHDGVLQIVGCLSNLVRLNLEFDFHIDVSRTDMDHISKLSKLQKCHIGSVITDIPDMGSEPSPSSYSWLTDHYFSSWTAKLPQLRDLRLSLERSTMYPLTQSSFQSLTHNCPLLTQCRLMWIHDLDTWSCLKPPVFPNLKVLHLRGVTKYDYGEDEEIIHARALRHSRMIRDLAPNLEDFNIQCGNFYEGFLLRAFKAGV